MSDFDIIAKEINLNGFYANVRNGREIESQYLIIGCGIRQNEIGIKVIENCHFVLLKNSLWTMEVPVCGDMQENNEYILSSRNIDELILKIIYCLTELKSNVKT